jgi:hypothetical protein
MYHVLRSEPGRIYLLLSRLSDSNILSSSVCLNQDAETGYGHAEQAEGEQAADVFGAYLPIVYPKQEILCLFSVNTRLSPKQHQPGGGRQNQERRKYQSYNSMNLSYVHFVSLLWYQV